MTSNCSTAAFSEFTVGDLVWANRLSDGIYWPGRIKLISNHLADKKPMYNYLENQALSYLVKFFEYNEPSWTFDILPYRQYRDYMSKHLSAQHDSCPEIKGRLLNAVNQANTACIQEKTSMSSNSFTTNENYSCNSTSNTIIADCENAKSYNANNYSMNSYYQSPTTHYSYSPYCPSNKECFFNTNCTYCTQTYFSSTDQLSINSNLNSMSQLNNDYFACHNTTANFRAETFQKKDYVIIITSKTYSNSSFISYIFNCLVNNFHSSIIYIDDLIDYQQPTTSNTFYLICLDYFDSIIQQTLNLTIVNNLNSHTNHFFLIINPPSYDFIKYFHSIIMDKQTILIVHYHSSFDNEPLLLCSGNRTTYEIVRSLLLKYLCSKIKYIESNESQQGSYDLFNANTWIPSMNKNYGNIPNIANTDTCLSSTMKSTKMTNFKDKKSKRKIREDETNPLSTTQSECCVENILEKVDSTK